MTASEYGELSARLELLETRDEIQRLKFEYASACDDGYDASRIASLFTPDGTFDLRPRRGLYSGREEIEEAITHIGTQSTWAMHYMCNPQIEVHGTESASGRWTLWEVITTLEVPYAVMAHYSDTYARFDGKWLHSSVKIQVEAFTPWTKGWVEQRFPVASPG